MPTKHKKRSPNANRRLRSEIAEFLQFGLGCLVVISFMLIGLGSRFVFGKSWIASFWLALLVAVSFKIIQEVVERHNDKKRRRNS